MDYKLVVDSCCDVSEELEEGIVVDYIPLSINIDNVEYVDDQNLDIDSFLAAINKSKDSATSACPAPEAFASKFREAKNVFVITLSSRLSGSYNSAVLAKDIVDGENKGHKIHIFDSLSASAGEILVGLKIKECLENKLDFEAIIEHISLFIKDMKTFFVLENLDTMVKNGRLGKVAGQLASVLSIRPVLGSDGDGNIKLFEKVRGTKKALIHLVDMIAHHAPHTEGRDLVITHCNNEEKALWVKSMIEEKYSFKKIYVISTCGLSSFYANEGGIIVAY
ncbi:MAG: DegV family protein [Clostridiales bacterium]